MDDDERGALADEKGLSQKRLWRKLLLLVLSLLVLAGIVVGGLLLRARSRLPSGGVGPPGRPYRPPPIAYEGDSTGLEQTVIVPTLDTRMPPGKNVIWCSSFQVAWNHLRDDAIKAPVKVANAEEIADRLNRAPQSEADLPEGSYYAAAGFVGDGIVETIQKEMAQRFPSAAKPTFEGLLPDAIVAYAYLTAGVKFTIPFFDSDETLKFQDSTGAETAVSAFGIRPEDEWAYRKLREQVQVLYSLTGGVLFESMFETIEGYEEYVKSRGGVFVPPEFAIDPCKDSSPCQIVLARIERKPTLAETLADLQVKVADWSQRSFFNRLSDSDVLLIPNTHWKIDHHFSKLEGADRLLRNPEFEGYWIERARQAIDFKLDRSGAELASEAEVIVESARQCYRFDRPFLIYLKKRGAEHPFFVMWVDNAELLCKWQGSPGGVGAGEQR